MLCLNQIQSQNHKVLAAKASEGDHPAIRGQEVIGQVRPEVHQVLSVEMLHQRENDIKVVDTIDGEQVKLGGISSRPLDGALSE